MARTVGLHGVRELLQRGAQLVEVLPQEEYDETPHSRAEISEARATACCGSFSAR